MKRAAKVSLTERARSRSLWLLAAFALAGASLEGRILYLQLVNKEFLTEQANDRHLRTVPISAHRGSLTDRYGEPLAVSTPVDTVFANPKELKPALDRLGELADVLDQDHQWLARRITSNLERDFVFLQRHLSPQKAEQVMRLRLPGVGTVREYRRYYPAGEVAGHVIGFTNVDDRDQKGLEAEFDHWLKDENGSKRVMQDRLGRVIDDVELLRAARPGRDLRTSIDLRLQYLAYRELKRAVTENRARSGSVVVLDPTTRDGQSADVQPERPVAISAGALSQPRGHGHFRAGIELQTVRDGRRARERLVQPAYAHRYVAGVAAHQRAHHHGGQLEPGARGSHHRACSVEQRGCGASRAHDAAASHLADAHRLRHRSPHRQRVSG